jgi:hypothetical protein
MWPRPAPPPLEPKPTLPIPPDDPEDTKLLLALAPTHDGSSLRPRVGTDARLLAAIDPDTGDSALHRAAAAGNYPFMEAVADCFGPNIDKVPRQKRLRWVLWTHRNQAGDTALHAAARAGSVRGVKGVYRLFWGVESHDPDEDGDRENWPPESAAENWEWEGNEGAAMPGLDFVCAKNEAGRDAAAEAREAGHEDVAVLLEGMAERLDPVGKRADEGYLREARRAALDTYWYYEGEMHGREGT